MPIYQYRCPACGHIFEVRRDTYGDEPECCPDCGETCDRVPQPVAVVFKGDGFYVTDNGGDNGPKTTR